MVLLAVGTGEVTSPRQSISANQPPINGIKLFVRKEMDDDFAAFAAAEQIDFGAQCAAQTVFDRARLGRAAPLLGF
jgi:hypothetical protein